MAAQGLTGKCGFDKDDNDVVPVEELLSTDGSALMDRGRGGWGGDEREYCYEGGERGEGEGESEGDGGSGGEVDYPDDPDWGDGDDEGLFGDDALLEDGEPFNCNERSGSDGPPPPSNKQSTSDTEEQAGADLAAEKLLLRWSGEVDYPSDPDGDGDSDDHDEGLLGDEALGDDDESFDHNERSHSNSPPPPSNNQPTSNTKEEVDADLAAEKELPRRSGEEGGGLWERDGWRGGGNPPIPDASGASVPTKLESPQPSMAEGSQRGVELAGAGERMESEIQLPRRITSRPILASREGVDVAETEDLQSTIASSMIEGSQRGLELAGAGDGPSEGPEERVESEMQLPGEEGAEAGSTRLESGISATISKNALCLSRMRKEIENIQNSMTRNKKRNAPSPAQPWTKRLRLAGALGRPGSGVWERAEAVDLGQAMQETVNSLRQWPMPVQRGVEPLPWWGFLEVMKSSVEEGEGVPQPEMEQEVQQLARLTVKDAIHETVGKAVHTLNNRNIEEPVQQSPVQTPERPSIETPNPPPTEEPPKFNLLLRRKPEPQSKTPTQPPAEEPKIKLLLKPAPKQEHPSESPSRKNPAQRRIERSKRLNRTPHSGLALSGIIVVCDFRPTMPDVSRPDASVSGSEITTVPGEPALQSLE